VRRFEGDDGLATVSRAGDKAKAIDEWPVAGVQGNFGSPGSNTLVSNCVPRDDTGKSSLYSFGYSECGTALAPWKEAFWPLFRPRPDTIGETAVEKAAETARAAERRARP
jgi:hypothetical protein